MRVFFNIAFESKQEHKDCKNMRKKTCETNNKIIPIECGWTEIKLCWKRIYTATTAIANSTTLNLMSEITIVTNRNSASG